MTRARAQLEDLASTAGPKAKKAIQDVVSEFDNKGLTHPKPVAITADDSVFKAKIGAAKSDVNDLSRQKAFPAFGANANAFQQTYISSFATNQSRNTDIDASIAPGPYKEVKPCEDLCYSLMQSCPAALGFVCPYPGRGLEASYGKRGAPGTIECSFLGAYYYQSGAPRAEPRLLGYFLLAAWAVLFSL